MTRPTNVTLTARQLDRVEADTERRLGELAHRFTVQAPNSIPRKLLGAALSRGEWLALSVDARRAHLRTVVREQVEAAAIRRVATAVRHRNAERAGTPLPTVNAKPTPAPKSTPSPSASNTTPTPTAPPAGVATMTGAVSTSAQARSAARVPVVAFVSCAAGCGRMLPARSTFRPERRYCGGTMTGRRAPRCLGEEAA